MNSPEWTTKDVQLYYHVCRTTVWRWVASGCPNVRTATGRLLFIPAEVMRWHKESWEKIKSEQ